MPIQYIQGDDPPADPATRSYFSNHVSFMVSDLAASRQWYGDVLGMRHIFTFELSSDYSIMYMGHSQGGKNGTGYQSGREMARDKTNMTGLIELVWYRVCSVSFDHSISNS
jgi:lactoylglutathione lyase